jgi:mono/diheme cytochrome c family protein
MGRVRGNRMRISATHLSAALVLLGGSAAALAQDVENGRRLSARWCSECHAIGPAQGKGGRSISFAAIAARQDLSSDMISSFLLMPHSTMPNMPLRRKDARDIAAFIMEMKK